MRLTHWSRSAATKRIPISPVSVGAAPCWTKIRKKQETKPNAPTNTPPPKRAILSSKFVSGAVSPVNQVLPMPGLSAHQIRLNCSSPQAAIWLLPVVPVGLAVLLAKWA